MVARILDTAARIFEAEGYQATTTNHVAEAAGVSVGSLYQYFPNKDALLVELADRHLAEAMALLVDEAVAVREAQLDLARSLERLLATALEVNARPVHRLLWTAPRTDELIARFDAAEEVMVSEVAWHLERSGWSGEALARRARLVVVAAEAAVHDPVLAADPHALVSELVTVFLAR